MHGKHEDIEVAYQGKTRKHPEVLAVAIDGKNIHEIADLSIDICYNLFINIQLTDFEREIGKSILEEIKKRLQFLKEASLGYLSPFRQASTLSGGEAQRIRLVSQIGPALLGVSYISGHIIDVGHLNKLLRNPNPTQANA